MSRFLLVAFLSLVACGGGDGGTPPVTPEISPGARAYVTAALDTMQRHSVRRDSIDWPTFRSVTFARIGAAQSLAETHDGLREAVRALGDRHSQFYEPGTFPSVRASVEPLDEVMAQSAAQLPSGRSLGNGIAYLFVPAFSGISAQAMRGRTDSTLDVVRRVDGEGATPPCGWIVDLRLNLGGNMYPMVAGVGPLLGDGDLGSFRYPDGRRTTWWHRAGASGYTTASGDVAVTTATAPYQLRRPGVPVAVLIGDQTASSGEFTALSFVGMSSARTFGTATYGLTSGNAAFRLEDGAVINLTVALGADRTGRVYGGRITPDQPTAAVVPNPATTSIDAGMYAASDWLRAQPACAGGA